MQRSRWYAKSVGMSIVSNVRITNISGIHRNKIGFFQNNSAMHNNTVVQ